jgi:hypothetical protein
MFQLGVGRWFATPYGGNLAANPTPQFFGTAQDFSLEIDQKLEELRGASQFPDDVGPTDRKVSGKIGFGKIELATLNQLYFADTSTTGVTAVSALENHTIPASPGPYTITITPPESGVFSADLGVIYGIAGGLGIPFTKQTVSAAGEYSVVPATGVYTFYSGDAGKSVQISYTYTLATVGATQQVNNQVLGWGPVFSLWGQLSYQVDVAGYPTNSIYVAACRAGKLSSPFKRAGYLIQTLDIEAFANASGQVMYWGQTTG